MPEALFNGIAVIEKLANGGHTLDNGAPAYWEDAEEFFRQAEWELLQDLELPPPPYGCNGDICDCPPRPDTFDPFQ